MVKLANDFEGAVGEIIETRVLGLDRT